MRYKLITKTCFNGKGYTVVYKVLCKKRWYLPWKGVTFYGIEDENLGCYDEKHEWYHSKIDAINALKNAKEEPKE